MFSPGRLFALAGLLCILSLHIVAGGRNDTLLSLDQVLADNYNHNLPPKINGKAVAVNVSVFILNIRAIDEGKQFYEMDIFFHQFWVDPRFKYLSFGNDSKLILDYKWREKLWTPDTYFKNSVDGKLDNIIYPYMYITIDKHSVVFFAARVSLKLSCSMDLAEYPHDVQDCAIDIMSLQNTNETVTLQWKDFILTKKLSLSQFEVKMDGHDVCHKTYSIGTFHCLTGTVKLTRRLGFFLINKYIPSVLIVSMSFVTFWIPPEAYPARVALSVTSLLTIVTQQYQSAMPNVSYVVALNVWMLACIGFVFLSLIEYAVVVTCIEVQRTRKARAAVRDTKAVEGGLKEQHAQSYNVITQEGSSRFSRLNLGRVNPRKIDRASGVLFPVAFIVHIVIYWAIYGT